MKMRTRRRKNRDRVQTFGFRCGRSSLCVEFSRVGEHFSDACVGFEDFAFGELEATFEFRVQHHRVGLMLHLETGENIEGLGATGVAAVDESTEELEASRIRRSAPQHDARSRCHPLG